MGELDYSHNCIYIEDISESESVCKKGFPTDESCWSGAGNHCPYYSTHYDPLKDEYTFREDNYEGVY